MTLQSVLEKITIPSTFKVGIAAHILSTGESAAVNALRPFQLASVFKVPVLVAALMQCELGRFRLDQRIKLGDADKIGGGILAYLEDGLSLTWRDLLTLMIIVSDNTAADIVLSHIGGCSAVTNTMNNIGLPDIQIRQTVRELIYAIEPVDALLLTDYDYIQYLKEHAIVVSTDKVMESNSSNFATAQSINYLFVKLELGKLLSEDNTAFARNVLLRQQSADRLPANLPYGTRVAHKTGTIAGVRNDAGIIYFPDNRAVAVSVLTEYPIIAIDSPEQNQRDAQVSALIARIGEKIYEYALIDRSAPATTAV